MEHKPLGTLAEKYFDPGAAGQPYSSAQQQLEDWQRLIDMLCAALLIRTDRGEGHYRRGYMGKTEDLLLTLETTSRVSTPPEPVPEFAAVMEELIVRGAASSSRGRFLPVQRLMLQLEPSPFELFCVMLAACADLSRRYERVFSQLQGGADIKRPTLGLAADLYTLMLPLPDAELYAMSHPESVCNLLAFVPFADTPELSRLSRPLALNKFMLYCILGLPLPADELSGFCGFIEPEADGAPVLAHEAEIRQASLLLRSWLENDPDDQLRVLHLHGAMGAGKRFVLQKAVSGLRQKLILADCSVLLKFPIAELRNKLTLLVAHSVMDGCLLCLHNFDITQEYIAHAGETFVLLSRFLSMVAVLSREPLPFALPDTCVCHAISVGSTSVDEQRAIWRYFDEENKLPEDCVESMTASYDLPAGHIRDAVKMAQMESDAGGTSPPVARLQNALREISRVPLHGVAELMQTGFTWDDLVVGEDALRLMRRVCARVRYKRLVGDQWGFNSKLPYGGGLTVLLYGPPGTGKTMAAGVIANELGRDIYRIDLSQMVSKYIGETEKNLGAVFDAARNVNAILFFDEADALFSKRTEVKDARDKYANTETSYLLQKIESHNGITILATNNALNLDVAFKRRINYFINIEMPDEAARLAIWQSVFTEAAPLSPKVDLRFFANKFDFSGSEIKSVVLEAAYLAAAQGGEITHSMLLSAIQEEFRKNGRVLLEQDVF